MEQSSGERTAVNTRTESKPSVQLTNDSDSCSKKADDLLL